MTTSAPLRRRARPHLREPGATYLVSWELHPDQPPLTEAERWMLLQTLLHFDNARFSLLAALVLDRKVYAVLTPFADRPLERIVGGWKRWASGQLGRGGTGESDGVATEGSGADTQVRRAPFWRQGYFDRVMRGPEETTRRIEQLRLLPGRQWPEAERYEWMWVRGEAREPARKTP